MTRATTYATWIDVQPTERFAKSVVRAAVRRYRETLRHDLRHRVKIYRGSDLDTAVPHTCAGPSVAMSKLRTATAIGGRVGLQNLDLACCSSSLLMPRRTIANDGIVHICEMKDMHGGPNCESRKV